MCLLFLDCFNNITKTDSVIVQISGIGISVFSCLVSILEATNIKVIANSWIVVHYDNTRFQIANLSVLLSCCHSCNVSVVVFISYCKDNTNFSIPQAFGQLFSEKIIIFYSSQPSSS